MNMQEWAHWSDGFFNYVPAEQACGEYYSTGTTESLADLLAGPAAQFLEVYPDCPLSAAELVKDFIGRI